jgi:hypothetical protein
MEGGIKDMKPIAVTLGLLFALAAVAAEKTWPSKGDVVYLSASLKQVSARKPVAGAPMKYDLPPCPKLEVVKANPDKLRWVVKDPAGGTEELEGPWLPHMHQDKSECETKWSAHGEPKVEHARGTYRIPPAESP